MRLLINELTDTWYRVQQFGILTRDVKRFSGCIANACSSGDEKLTAHTEPQKCGYDCEDCGNHKVLCKTSLQQLLETTTGTTTTIENTPISTTDIATTTTSSATATSAMVYFLIVQFIV